MQAPADLTLCDCDRTIFIFQRFIFRQEKELGNVLLLNTNVKSFIKVLFAK